MAHVFVSGWQRSAPVERVRARNERFAKVVRHEPRIGSILHPGPADPRASTGWAEAIEQQVRDSGCISGSRT